MATLQLRLASPLQSWGSPDSHYNYRKTERFPTKSGVIGMIANALGYDREKSVDELADKIKVHVRCDQKGIEIKDFQTVKDKIHNQKFITDRYYLSDAVFFVVLESDDVNLLEQVKEALEKPKRIPYLGRKSCVPTFPLVIKDSFSLEDNPLEILKKHEFEGNQNSYRMYEDTPIDIYYDGEVNEKGKETILIKDYPITYSTSERKCKIRKITKISIPFTSIIENPEEEHQTVNQR